MPLDHYITLGRSGLRVSPFCLGAMTFGEDWGWGSSVEESVRVVDAYLDRGGNFIDTANIYTKGHSEAILGDYFADGPGRGKRDGVVIATKFGGNMYRGDPNGGGSSRKSILRNCEQSLRRLRTDFIDLYWVHFLDRDAPIDETLRALDDLVRQGKVRYLGLSDHPAWVCAQAQYEARLHGWAPIVALQIEYSLLQRTVEAELMPMARALGMGVTPWSPLRSGILTGKYRRDSRPPVGTTRVPEESKYLNERTYRIVDELEAVGREVGGTVAQVALAWVQSRAGVASTIIGARTVAQLEDNLGALALNLGAEQIARLDECSRVDLAFPTDFLDFVRHGIQNGTNVNGFQADPWALSPVSDDERW